MLVTFADSHSALSVLDVDGMKVRGSPSHCGAELARPHSYAAGALPVSAPQCVTTPILHLGLVSWSWPVPLAEAETGVPSGFPLPPSGEPFAPFS